LGQTVLVVDDDLLVVRGVSRVLERAGYDVLTATDVDGALVHTDCGHLDAAIVDFTLARSTGVAVLEKLKASHAQCVRILITGRRDPESWAEAVNKGEIHGVVRKPFEGPVLVRTLEDVLKREHQKSEHARLQPSPEHKREREALTEAIRPERLTLALQGIVDVTPGVAQPVVGWEALLRPQHSAFHTPVSLLDMAERHDRVLDVGSAVLAIALTIVDTLPPTETLFVNLHPAQLGDPDRLARDLEPFGARARQVALEITERSRMGIDRERWEESIRLIQASAFSLALDDLGAGYSSLTVICDSNPKIIKIDMELVRNVHNEPRKLRMVSLLRACGVDLGATVIAEGVETAGEAQALFDCGIRWMQGFYYAMPVPFTAGVPPRLP
jgi:EAL domain-containing protein (putative c-di-GMP-specific phosphodiesterase class I)/ActR/RegA family two-component response regulator